MAPTPAASNQNTNTYTGDAFSIQYPRGWSVTSGEVQKSWGTDTTIVSPDHPNVLIRIDVTTNPGTTDPAAAAQPVINALAQQSGYQQLDLTSGTFESYPAEHWEFLVTESGASLHKEDEFFTDTANGDSVAVLTQAPAAEYSSLSARFASLRQSLSMN